MNFVPLSNLRIARTEPVLLTDGIENSAWSGDCTRRGVPTVTLLNETGEMVKALGSGSRGNDIGVVSRLRGGTESSMESEVRLLSTRGRGGELYVVEIDSFPLSCISFFAPPSLTKVGWYEGLRSEASHSSSPEFARTQPACFFPSLNQFLN